MSYISKKLILWHKTHGRHQLPWQNTENPYAIWVSEIMLQQTQVSTVIGYYQKFITRFPDINRLAIADIDEVNELWSGLGYYNRARNLHAAAKIISKNYKGIFPDRYEKILELPGIGRTTAGAICAFSFGQHYPILDGNVKRVFARFFGIKEWTGLSLVEKELWKIAEKNLPMTSIQVYTQALMDLGATLCVRSKPRCGECPLKNSCKSFLNQWTSIIPSPKVRKKIPVKEGHILIVQYAEQILFVKRDLRKVWGGLWSLPELEKKDDLDQWLLKFLKIKKSRTMNEGIYNATFSHYKYVMHYQHILIDNINIKIPENHQWLAKTEIQQAGVPTPIKKLLVSL
jgi:A/G-specific adenine glycosylase